MPHQKIRVEQDSLGQIEVPVGALYGAQTARALLNFQISGRTAHPSLIRAYLAIKDAAARANLCAGTLEPEQARMISHAVEVILAKSEREWTEIFPVDPYQAGAGTSQNMNINEVIANVANLREHGAESALGRYEPIHPNDHVNRSQSTNDTYPTAIRLALLDLAPELCAELRQLAVAFGEKASQWRAIPKAARTHLNDAVPMRLGQEFGAYAWTIEKCAERIDSSLEELRELGIGGSAAGTALTVPQDYLATIVPELARASGQKLRRAPDLCEAMQSQAPLMEYSSMLRVMALELTRICNDLRLLASGPLTGLGEITLPAVQPGSSIMPGKINPSILEMVNQVCFSVLGYDHTTAMAMQAGQLELNVMMPVMAFSILEATTIATRAVRTLRERCISGMSANATRLAHYFEATPQMATALSARLGYERTAELVQRALHEGSTVVALVRREKLISDAELEELLEPVRRIG